MRHFSPGDSIDHPEGLVLSGRRRTGKSFIAEESGYDIFGVADPMYELSRYELDTADKSVGDVRPFLQNVGAVGRGDEPEQETDADLDWDELAETYRHHGFEITEMATPGLWEEFGTRSDFWVQVLGGRIEGNDSPVAVPNGRFPDEINFLTEEKGFAHVHVMCSEDTRIGRMLEAGEDPSKGEDDSTEQLAQELDKLALQETDFGYTPDPDSLWPELSSEVVFQITTLESVVWSDDPGQMPRRLEAAAQVKRRLLQSDQYRLPDFTDTADYTIDIDQQSS